MPFPFSREFEYSRKPKKRTGILDRARKAGKDFMDAQKVKVDQWKSDVRSGKRKYYD